ncbi:hypothetical protein LX87_05363 [Larkinella arboricola]|uniref:Uncharacterized protein n=1 Tax=Larkinella arboricola TaxID=643671 RepID=A0A327WHI7_LARAB|nr:hypothetical protein LX87_05363 [Larkinella arboricola]
MAHVSIKIVNSLKHYYRFEPDFAESDKPYRIQVRKGDLDAMK